MKLGGVPVEHPQVKSGLGVVPVPYLRRVRGEIGLLIAERLTGPHVGLGVLDGRPTFG